jgi:hypothetical protein
MFFRLNPIDVEKIKFFDAIMSYLTKNYSKKVNLDELKTNINYTDERIKNLSYLDSFFERDNVPQTYQKSLNLLIDLGYIVQDMQQYSLTVNGLIVSTSGGLLGKERREMNKYNFQTFVWILILTTFLVNLGFQIASFSKSSDACQICTQHTKVETNYSKNKLQIKQQQIEDK